MLGHAYFWQLHLNGKICKMKDDELAEIRNKKLICISNLNLLPRTTALDNVALPMIYAGYSKSERKIRAEEVLTQGIFIVWTTTPTNHPGQRQRVAVARAL
jgi:putative ABC transport system ATP-binding protein